MRLQCKLHVIWQIKGDDERDHEAVLEPCPISNDSRISVDRNKRATNASSQKKPNFI